MMRSEHHIGMHSFHNILISKSALVFLEQLIARKNSHFFQSRTNPNSKKNAFCYTFNVRTIISTKIMKEHTESTVRRGHGMCNRRHLDRKSTRLNSSHQIISYAVFCFKKKTI